MPSCVCPPCSNIRHLYKYTLLSFVCFSPHFSSSSAASFSCAGLSSFFTPVNENSSLQQHLSGLFVQPILPQLSWSSFFKNFFILLHSLSSRALRFSNRPAMPFDVGRRGFIQVWRPVLPPPSLWCCVHPQPGAGASSESPVFRAPEMNRGPVDGARLWGPVVSPLLHAEAWICYRPGRLPAGEERGWLKGSYDALAHALTAGELIRRCVCVCLRVSMCPPCAHVLPPWLSACPTCLTEHLCVCLN